MQKLMLVLVALNGCAPAAPLVEKEEEIQEITSATRTLFVLCGDETATIEDFRLVLSNEEVQVNAMCDNWTPLMSVARWNSSTEVITALINAGAEVRKRGQYGWTPLMNAAIGNPNPEVITALIQRGADINSRDDIEWTPLIGAAKFNPNPEVITTLINAGADVKARNEIGQIPLMGAAGRRNHANLEVITVLLAAGADAKAKDKDGKTALDYAKANAALNGTDGDWKLTDASF